MYKVSVEGHTGNESPKGNWVSGGAEIGQFFTT